MFLRFTRLCAKISSLLLLVHGHWVCLGIHEVRFAWIEPLIFDHLSSGVYSFYTWDSAKELFNRVGYTLEMGRPFAFFFVKCSKIPCPIFVGDFVGDSHHFRVYFVLNRRNIFIICWANKEGIDQRRFVFSMF